MHTLTSAMALVRVVQVVRVTLAWMVALRRRRLHRAGVEASLTTKFTMRIMVFGRGSCVATRRLRGQAVLRMRRSAVSIVMTPARILIITATMTGCSTMAMTTAATGTRV
jgi:hypothetical protein